MHIQPAFRATPSPAHAGLPEAAVLSSMQPAAITLFDADAVIYAQGDKAGPLYFVEFGTIRISRMSADGRRQITAFHTAGDVFGFEAGSEHESYAESVDGAGIRVLRSTAGQQPAADLLRLALASLARTQGHLMLLGRRSANERMAAFLLDLCERQAEERHVHFAMQRNDIADYLGMTFETVSRVLRHLKDERIIRMASVSQIEILDRAALEEMCD